MEQTFLSPFVQPLILNHILSYLRNFKSYLIMPRTAIQRCSQCDSPEEIRVFMQWKNEGGTQTKTYYRLWDTHIRTYNGKCTVLSHGSPCPEEQDQVAQQTGQRVGRDSRRRFAY